jgi:hypothetical protein
MEELGFHRTNFREILYWEFLVKPVRSIQVCFKYDKNNILFKMYVRLCQYLAVYEIEYDILQFKRKVWGKRRAIKKRSPSKHDVIQRTNLSKSTRKLWPCFDGFGESVVSPGLMIYVYYVLILRSNRA